MQVSSSSARDGPSSALSTDSASLQGTAMAVMSCPTRGVRLYEAPSRLRRGLRLSTAARLSNQLLRFAPTSTKSIVAGLSLLLRHA